MKRTLFSLIIFLALILPVKSQMLQGIVTGKNDTGCVKDTGTLVMDQQIGDSGQPLASDAGGQSFGLGGASWSFYSAELNFNSYCSNCVVTVRIGSTANLNTYDEEWANVAIPDSGGWKEFLSSKNTTYTTAYIGVSEVSGTCNWLRSTSGVYANGDRYDYPDSTGWSMTSPKTGTDHTMKVYKCQ